MKDFYFFTELDAVSSVQTKEQALGQVSSTYYRINNQFSSKAEAATDDGILFVQQCRQNPECVNLTFYPSNNCGFNFPTIKLYSYHSIKKKNLFGSKLYFK